MKTEPKPDWNRMLPVGPLMIEHRRIERMIAVLSREAQRMESTHRADPVFVDTAVDFIRTYADRCHHGKEENILFRELEKKPLPEDLAATTLELIEEHHYGRSLVRRMEEANSRYAAGDESALAAIAGVMRSLAEFYPRHIEKEDRRFFLPVMKFFTKGEQDAMLEEGRHFDETLIHLKYEEVVERAEAKAAGS